MKEIIEFMFGLFFVTSVVACMRWRYWYIEYKKLQESSKELLDRNTKAMMLISNQNSVIDDLKYKVKFLKVNWPIDGGILTDGLGDVIDPVGEHEGAFSELLDNSMKEALIRKKKGGVAKNKVDSSSGIDKEWCDKLVDAYVKNNYKNIK